MARSSARLETAPIFVVGAARSGTTWVYDILTAHPMVAGAYETWLFTPNQGLGSLFGPGHYPPGSSGLGRSFPRQLVVEEVRRLVDALFAERLGPGQRYLVEKSPSHVASMPLIRDVLPEARFIHVLRDGRDVSVSVRQAARSWAPRWRRSFGRHLYTSARAWRHAVRRVQGDGPELGEALLEIRFEQLKSDPVGGITRLFEHCRIPCEPGVPEQIAQRTDFDTNYRSSETAFRRGGRVGDWRTRFSLIDRLVFNQAAGDALIATGYERDRSWVLHPAHR